MSNSYWQSIAHSRVDRRRVLIGTGVTAASAAFLAACGGSNNSGGSKSAKGGSSDKSGLLATPVDSTNSAKAGGVLKHYSTSDTLHFDSLSSNTAQVVGQGSVLAYTRLLKFTPGKYPDSPTGDVEGETAESYEISPDKMQITLKLRQNMKWDPRAPTNGRNIDMQDITFSWKKYVANNPGAPNMVYDAARSPGSPVESMTTPDDKTIVYKLKQPNSLILTLIATPADGMYVMPRESEGGFDPKNATRGAGPWLLDEYVPSARYVWKKNPNYYVKGRPFPDSIEIPIVSEAAQQQAQFRAGNIYTDVVLRNQQAVLPLKKDVPLSQLMVQPFPVTASPYIWFGYEGDSKFKDIRVRQAMSMMFDPDGYNDTINNASEFKSAGLELPAARPTIVGVGWTGFWLDPTSKDFGPNAKYLTYNVAEAKKLLAAAGFQNGFEFEFNYNKEGTYGPAYDKTAQLYAGFFSDAGLKPQMTGQAYSNWIPNFYQAYNKANFNAGKAKGYTGTQQIAERPYVSASNLLVGSFHSDGGNFHGLTPDGKNPQNGDPKLDGMIDQIKNEFDTAKQQSIMKDLQRYATGQAYSIPAPMIAKPFTVTWPVIGNYGMWARWAQDNASYSEEYLNWWIDTSKPPITKS